MAAAICFATGLNSADILESSLMSNAQKQNDTRDSRAFMR